jgi:hypothetical protein
MLSRLFLWLRAQIISPWKPLVFLISQATDMARACNLRYMAVVFQTCGTCTSSRHSSVQGECIETLEVVVKLWVILNRPLKQEPDELLWFESEQTQLETSLSCTDIRSSVAGLLQVSLRTLKPSDRRLSVKLVPTFVVRGCCMVSAKNSHGR